MFLSSIRVFPHRGKTLRMCFLTFFLFASVLGRGGDSFILEIKNKGKDTLSQQIVSYPISDKINYNPKVVEVRDGRTEEVATQYDGKGGRLLLLLPGQTKPEDVRSFHIFLKEKSSAKTDLKLIETRDSIIISNTYFKIKHPKKGGGGFFSEITFNISGNSERFVLEDRLYEKDKGYFTLRGDPNSFVKVVSSGPLEIIVEAKARYFSDHYAPGEARATYRYIYHAYSPYIEVSAKVEKDDDFHWSELHFLQISRKDNTFPYWAGGEPFQKGQFTDSRQGKMLERWAIMFNNEDAIGLYTEKGISLYDGISDYYNYIQEAVSPFSERERSLHALLYIGPTPENIEKTFALIEREAKMEITPLQVQQPSYHTPHHSVENKAMAIGFSAEEEGLGIVNLINKQVGTPLIQVPSEEKPLIWRLVFSQGGKNNLTIDNTVPSQKDFQMKRTSSGWEVLLQWKNIDLEDERSVVNVTVKVELPEKSSISIWRINVDNRSKKYGLWEVHFPLLSPLGKSGEVDVAVPRSNWGYLYRGLKGSVSGYYPSCDWPMQFLSLNIGDCGLYLACHDPEAWTKSFSYTPGAQFFFNIRAENMGVAGSDFASFPIAVGIYKGNWLTACKIYREWALKNAPWTKKGPLTTRKDTPKSIKELGLWMLGGGTKDEVVPNMLKAQEFFQVPIGIHWYNWHQIGFDTEYPNYFPYKPGFPQGVKELTRRNILAMPYINGRLWDSALDSFKNQAITWCAKQVNGEPYIEVYNPQVKHAVMCPYTKFWQDKVNEIVERLVKECGVNAIYIDQIGAAGSVLCFDKNHGHPLGGGGYWVSGYRELLGRVKEKVAGKVAITTENNTECYMDGVDAFLIWNPRYPSEIPMMTAVYSGYTIYFSSPTHGYSDTISFRMLQGRDFIWGCQLGWMGFELLAPEHKEKAEFLKMLAKYRMATLKYIIYGELLGEINPLNPVPTVQGTWFGWNGQPFKAELPAVMGALWKGSDGTIGALIVNVSDTEQVFSFPSPKEFLPKGRKVQVSEIFPEGKSPFVSANESIIKIVLPPSSVRVLEFQAVAHKEVAKLYPFYQFIYSIGLQCDLDTDKKEVAGGEEYGLIFKAKSQKPLKLSLYLGDATYNLVLDGKKETKLVIPRIAPYDPQILVQKGTVKIANYQFEVVASLNVLPRFTLSLSSDTIRAGETANLVVKVKNNSSSYKTSRLFLQLPPQAKILPASSLEVAIPGYEESEFFFQVSLPADFPTGEIKVKAYMGNESGVLPLKVLPPPPLIFCNYVSMRENWQKVLRRNSPLVLKRENLKISQWKGEEDLSASAWLGWDEENFYFLIDVRDDVFNQPFRGKDIWQGDCIQMAFRPSGVADIPTYDGVYEFGLALRADGEEVYQWSPKEVKVSSAFCRITRDGNLTRYEFALPWREIGIRNPVIGRELGWAFTVNDNDGEGFRGWWEWAGGICGTKDASLFGKLILTNLKGG